MTVQTWLYENAKQRRGEEAAESQREALSDSLPQGILAQPASLHRCKTVQWILEVMGEQQQRDLKNDRGKTPQSINMNPYADCETVGDLVERYMNEHASTSGIKMVGALRQAFPDAWDLKPEPSEQRRWVYTLHLTCPPQKLRNQFERARLRKGMPGRN